MGLLDDWRCWLCIEISEFMAMDGHEAIPDRYEALMLRTISEEEYSVSLAD